MRVFDALDAFLWGLLVVAMSGCGADDGDANSASSTLPQRLSGERGLEPGQIIDPELAPEEVVHRGKHYVRVDLFAESDFERSLLDAPEDGPLARDKLARQLRAHMLKNGVHYVEAHLDYELVDEILGGKVPEPTEPAPDLEGRTIFGSDDRIPLDWQGNIPFYSKALAFSERGLGGALIGPTTALTCGHCMYETGDVDDVPNGWRCANDTVSSNCNGPGYPDWKFGLVNGTEGVTEWISYSCIVGFVPQQYIDLTISSSSANKRRWDFGVLDIDCPQFMGGTTYLGSDILTNSELLSVVGKNWGYPTLVPCPAGANGDFDDCPDGDLQLLGAPVPFTGGRAWDIVDDQFEQLDTHSMKTKIDATKGQSGSVVFDLRPTGPYVFGILTQTLSTHNIGRRWNSEYKNWVLARADLP